MKKINFISLRANTYIAQLFSDHARAQGFTSSDFVRVLVRAALQKAGRREYKMIEPPESRELPDKVVTGDCIQAEVHPEVKEAFRKYAKEDQRVDMQKAMRSLVFDTLVERGENLSFDQMHFSYEPEAIHFLNA